MKGTQKRWWDFFPKYQDLEAVACCLQKAKTDGMPTLFFFFLFFFSLKVQSRKAPFQQFSPQQINLRSNYHQSNYVPCAPNSPRMCATEIRRGPFQSEDKSVMESMLTLRSQQCISGLWAAEPDSKNQKKKKNYITKSVIWACSSQLRHKIQI